MKNWIVAAVAGAAAVAGLGGGYLIGRAAPDPGPRTATGTAPSGPLALLGLERPRDANAERPSNRSGKFEFLRLRLDTSGAEPAACLEFSKPLSSDPSVRWADYLELDPVAAPVARVDGEALCLTGLGFEPARTLTLKAGAPAASGETLRSAETMTVDFGEAPPFVGFPGSGVILPRLQADGLGVQSANVARIRLEVRQVSDKLLPIKDDISEGGVTDQWGWPNWDYAANAENQARPVWTGEMDVKGPRNARTTTVFPLGSVLKDRRPGVYVIRATDASPGAGGSIREDGEGTAEALRWVIYTDMAVTTYRGQTGLDLVVRSLQTARPLAGARVVLAAANADELGVATTDAEGRARFDAPLLAGTGPLQARWALVYGRDGDFTAHDLARAGLDLSERGIEGRARPGDVDAWLYADRGVYRPGENVRLVALARDARGVALAGAREGAVVWRRPNGSEALRTRIKLSASGDAAVDYAIPRDAARGRWSAQLLLDGVKDPVGALSVSVEDFVPQRLAVEAKADQPVWTPQTPTAVDVRARFLYGAPGSALAVSGETRLTVDPNPFPKFAGYSFGKADELFEERLIELGQATTDGEGAARIALALGDLPATSKPLRAETVVSVFEPGGRPVRERVATPIRLAPVLIGVKPRFEAGRVASGQDAAFDVVALNAAGAAIARPLSWSVVEEDWDYDWYQEDGSWRYRRTSRDIPIARGDVAAAANGPAKLARRLDDGWYRLELTDRETGAQTSVRFAVGWGGTGDVDTPDTVVLGAPTQPVRPGRSAKIAINAPYAGEAQIAIATDRLVALRTVSVPAGARTIDVPVTEDWGGGAYVLVSVITPRDPGTRPVPRRAVGAVWVPVDRSDRTLKVAVGGPAKITPRTKMQIPVEVSGAGLGQEVRVTLAAVDEGVLRLTAHQSPDPVKWFFGKPGLGVEVRDDYGRLLDPNLGAPAALRSGGDGLGGEGLTVVPTKTVALFSGVVTTGIGGRATVTLDVPDFQGELRLMAVAWTRDAVGSASRPMTVRDPVVAELTLPRFLAPGDEALATLLLDNVEGANGAYAARITGAGALAGLAPASLSATLERGQRRVLTRPVSASAAGIGGLKLEVTGPGGFKVVRDVPIQIRPAQAPATLVASAPLAPGQRFVADRAVLANWSPDAAASVSFSATRGFDSRALATALAGYPYGCTEQLVSVAMPLVYRNELLAANGQDRDPNASRRVLDSAGKVMDRLGEDGAIGLWRLGDGQSSPWLGAYATDFLARAKTAGAAVPQTSLDQAYAGMRQVAKLSDWSSSGYQTAVWTGPGQTDSAELMKSRGAAYALWTLARAGKTDLGPVRYFADARLGAEPSPLARAQVGAALSALGDNARARRAFRQAEAALGYRNNGDWYQSPVRDLAGVLALAAETSQTDMVARLSDRLAREAPDPQSLNTQELAQLALAARALEDKAGPVLIAANGGRASPARGVVFPLAGEALARGQSFANAGKGPVFRNLVVTGVPASPLPAVANGISVSRRLFTPQGAALDPAAGLTQGDRVVVAVTVTGGAGRLIPALALDMLPAGLEIETVLTPSDAQGDGGARGAYAFLGAIGYAKVAEARDDRFVAALDAGQGATTVAYVARAVTPGSFTWPAVQAEDMYRPSVVARTAPGRLAIRPAP